MKIRSRRLTLFLAWIAAGLLRFLYWTCRKQLVMDDEALNPYSETGDQRYLYSIWHDQLLMTIFSGRSINNSGLVSRHQDGSYLADAMKIVGITPIRGSHNHGGAEAMRQMLETAKDYHICITPDGPRGPRREIKDGILFLASRSGRGIVPVAMSCKSCWNIQGSWTDMMIPKPFTKIYARVGQPIYIPAGVSREELGEYREAVAARMTQMELEVEQLRQGTFDPASIETPPSPATEISEQQKAA